MAPQLEYARTEDGVSIAYFSLGGGPAVVFASNMWGDANMYAAPHPHTRYMTDRLVELGWRVVRYDVRGFGASQREIDDDFSIEKRLLDLSAVADKLAIRSFAVAGVDAAAPIALAYAARNPARVTGVLAINGWLNANERTSHSSAQQALASMDRLAYDDWGFFSMALAKLVTELDDPVHTRRLAELFRGSTRPQTHHAFAQAFESYQLGSIVASVRAPVLVVHDTGFPFGSLDVCQKLAAALLNARLTVVNADREAEVQAIDAFLRSTGEKPIAATETQSSLTLTPRELEVLRLIAAGRTNREISDELVLSVRTVARHITNVYGKIGARGKAEATAYAIYHHLT